MWCALYSLSSLFLFSLLPCYAYDAVDIPDIVLVIDMRKQTRGARKPKPKPILLSPSDQCRGIRDL